MTNKDTKPEYPRSLIDSDYRYTVAELIPQFVAHEDGRVTLLDTFSLGDYRYKSVPTQTETNRFNKEKPESIHSMFKLFYVSEDDFSTYSDTYWDQLVPGGNLLKYYGEPNKNGHYNLVYASTKLLSVYSLNSISVVHTIPLEGLALWLKFVSHELSELPRATAESFKPFELDY